MLHHIKSSLEYSEKTTHLLCSNPWEWRVRDLLHLVPLLKWPTLHWHKLLHN